MLQVLVQFSGHRRTTGMKPSKNKLELGLQIHLLSKYNTRAQLQFHKYRTQLSTSSAAIHDMTYDLCITASRSTRTTSLEVRFRTRSTSTFITKLLQVWSRPSMTGSNATDIRQAPTKQNDSVTQQVSIQKTKAAWPRNWHPNCHRHTTRKPAFILQAQFLHSYHVHAVTLKPQRLITFIRRTVQ